MNTQPPVRFYALRWKAFFFGLITTAMFMVLAAALVKAVLLGDLAAFGFIVIAVLTVSFATAATNYLGIFLRHPAMVELSAQGISGEGFAPLAWSDIAEVAACKGRKRHRYLGITLKNPAQTLQHQPLLTRLKSRLWQWRYDRDIAVEMFLLKTDAAEEITAAARKIDPTVAR